MAAQGSADADAINWPKDFLDKIQLYAELNVKELGHEKEKEFEKRLKKVAQSLLDLCRALRDVKGWDDQKSGKNLINDIKIFQIVIENLKREIEEYTAPVLLDSLPQRLEGYALAGGEEDEKKLFHEFHQLLRAILRIKELVTYKHSIPSVEKMKEVEKTCSREALIKGNNQNSYDSDDSDDAYDSDGDDWFRHLTPEEYQRALQRKAMVDVQPLEKYIEEVELNYAFSNFRSYVPAFLKRLEDFEKLIGSNSDFLQ